MNKFFIFRSIQNQRISWEHILENENKGHIEPNKPYRTFKQQQQFIGIPIYRWYYLVTLN